MYRQLERPRRRGEQRPQTAPTAPRPANRPRQGQPRIPQGARPRTDVRAAAVRMPNAGQPAVVRRRPRAEPQQAEAPQIRAAQAARHIANGNRATNVRSAVAMPRYGAPQGTRAANSRSAVTARGATARPAVQRPSRLRPPVVRGPPRPQRRDQQQATEILQDGFRYMTAEQMALLSPPPQRLPDPRPFILQPNNPIEVEDAAAFRPRKLTRRQYEELIRRPYAEADGEESDDDNILSASALGLDEYSDDDDWLFKTGASEDDSLSLSSSLEVDDIFHHRAGAKIWLF